MLIYPILTMDVKLGDKAKRSMKIDKKHVDLFAEMSGDRNPLHFDEEFASKTKFKRLIAHGGVTTSILNALVAEDMPGPGTVFLSQDIKFTKPVYIGDTITAEAEVLKVHEKKPVCHLKISIKNQDGETVLEGEAWTYTLRPEA